MKRKTISAILLMLCMLVSMLPVTVSAAQINSITMTGNIIPSVNQNLKFATAPTHAIDDYTIVQLWVVDEKAFTDTPMYNQALEDEGILLPESERVFKSEKSYAYWVMLRPNKATFADDLTVKLGSRKLIKMNTDFGEYTYSIAFCYDKKMHISSPNWIYNETEHWCVCEDNDGYVFDETKYTHDFDSETYACSVCGYVLPESKTTKITKQPADLTISCGDTLELSTEATGSNLRYYWRWGDEHSLYDSSDWNGMKVSGSNTPNLKIENFGGQYAEKYKGIYCYVEGVRGMAKTKTANITVQHNNKYFDPIDGNGHDVVCSCGKVMQESESHTYGTDDKCEKCRYKKGSTQTPFKSATLDAPGFAEGKSVAESIETLKFYGDGIKGYTAEWLTSAHVPISTGTFNVNTPYILRIYPVFDNNYYLLEGNTATITYNGKEKMCALMLGNGKTYFNILIGNPPKNIKMTFESNGGKGTQAPIYADEYSEIYFPKCKFTKDGDEFFAWRVMSNGKYVLKSPDPDRFVGYKITEDTKAEAIWDSQRIKDIAITMDGITEGKTVNEMNFSLPEGAGYRFGGTVNWYLGDSTERRYKLNGNRALSMNENYTIQMVLASDTGFGDDDLKVTLNGRNVTGVTKQGLEYLIITIKILNNVSVDFWEPMEGLTLAKRTEMTKNSEDFDFSAATLWYDKPDGALKDKLDDGTIAERGKTYYLTLDLKNKVENQVFGGGTVRVNGKDYPITSRSAGYIRAKNIPFITTYPQVRISEDSSNGDIIIDSPKEMNIALAAGLYNSTGMLIGMITAPNLALNKGTNTVPLSKITNAETAVRFWLFPNEKVKVMAFQSMSNLHPLCPLYNYKYKAKN